MLTTAATVPPLLTTLVGRLTGAVPRRARTTFTELLIGAAGTRGGQVVDLDRELARRQDRLLDAAQVVAQHLVAPCRAPQQHRRPAAAPAVRGRKLGLHQSETGGLARVRAPRPAP